MGLNLYEIAVSIIGELPEYLHFLYGFGVVFLFFGILTIVLFPLILICSIIPKYRR